MSSVATTLPLGAGYGVVVGVGFFFAFVMMGISALQNRYTRFSTKQSEEFNTASRNVKPGLIASGIMSAWTWAATLLQSSSVGYQYGIAGPFWVCTGHFLGSERSVHPSLSSSSTRSRVTTPIRSSCSLEISNRSSESRIATERLLRLLLTSCFAQTVRYGILPSPLRTRGIGRSISFERVRSNLGLTIRSMHPVPLFKSGCSA